MPLLQRSVSEAARFSRKGAAAAAQGAQALYGRRGTALDAFRSAGKVIAELRPQRLKVTPSNAQLLGSRDEQEDTLCCSNFDDAVFVEHGGVLAIVADGMGGWSFGREASNSAAQQFLRAYEAKRPAESVQAALFRSIGETNRAALGRARGEAAPPDTRYGLREDSAGVPASAAPSGTTLLAAVIYRRELHYVSVGDSRLYLLRRGALIPLSTDHDYAAVLAAKVRAGELSEQAALEHPERHALTSYVGMPELPRVSLSESPIPLERGDVVFLCSDGVYNTLTVREMERAIEEAPSVMERADAVIRAVRQMAALGQDNASVICLSCS